MSKLNGKKRMTVLDEKTKIGITLLIFGIFILSSVFLIYSDSDKEEKDGPSDTLDLIEQSGRFFGGVLILAGIVLIISVYFREGD
ncbi:MAG: hypothetical protein ACOC5D_02570 [Thermoplasmatota archaeon]